MADNERLQHIHIREAAQTEEYVYAGGGRATLRLPQRDRKTHAERLLSQLDTVRAEAKALKRDVSAWAVPAKAGIHLEFESEPGFDLELKSLDDRRPGGIELVAVRESPDTEGATLATVYVPAGKLAGLERKIHKYQSEETQGGKPWHRKLVEKISHIRLAQLRSFWTDREDLFPDTHESIWWEVWLRSPDEGMLESFVESAGLLGIEVAERRLRFPSTQVVLAHGSLEQLSQSIEAVDSIAELRRAKELASLFMELPREEMGEWVDDLAGRTDPPPLGAPRICLLDTGVTAGHPLLRIALDQKDLHTIDPAWGVEDSQETHERAGHGTGMSGLALYGDLTERLASAHRFELAARLESVRILPPPPKENDPDLYGDITQQAVYRVEVEEPGPNHRTHLMAVTATDGRERGRPSSWSAAVDQLAYGDQDEPRRLWVLAAGNSDRSAWADHPEHLETEEIHDPGQAWNALTVGAFTDKWQVDGQDFEGWEPVAHPGDLSPSTTTSSVWNTSWPLKPDLVMEGGNAARSPDGEIEIPDSLSLLTTYYRPSQRLLTDFGETSAASALVAHFAGAIQAQYPDYWPETIRALLVHTSSWTPQMLERFGPLNNKRDYERLIRRCGFGVPDLQRALWSARNSLTLVAQESFQPFERKSNRTNLKELQIHEIPWPVQALRDLGGVEIELRVTLSYFIEPNPAERGHLYRHRYASHGFRFDVRGAAESPEEFRKRLNKAARAEGEKSPGTADPSGWLVGSDARHRGSLHSDIWRGTAADLANRQHVAVYPVSGWWKERHNLGRWQRDARYALVLSINAPEVEVDLYTPVRVAAEIPIQT